MCPASCTSRSSKVALHTSVAKTAQKIAYIEHPLEPVFDEHSRVLILGTMPSPKSREVGFYYGHPQNRFWRVMAALTDEPLPTTNEERKSLILRHHLALWDVCASCEIAGASDASLRHAQPNDLSQILRITPLELVATTGTTAARLYKKLLQPQYPDLPLLELPSTSGANASMRLVDLVQAYEALRPFIT